MDKGETKRIETYGHLAKKGGEDMHFIKILILIGLSLAIGVFGCAKEQKNGGFETGSNHPKSGSPEFRA